MRHRFTIPPPGHEPCPDLSEWLQHFGWHVICWEWPTHPGLSPTCPVLEQRVTIAPWRTEGPAWRSEITVYSGTTLLYDDAEQALGVSLLAEPPGAPPARDTEQGRSRT